MAVEDDPIEDKQRWERPTVFYNVYTKYVVYVAIAAFVIWSLTAVDVTLARFLKGLDEAARVGNMAWPPNYSPRFRQLIYQGTFDSIGIAVLATIGGVLISIPFAFMGAKNIAPKPMYYFARGSFVFTRAFHPLIVGIIFVKAVGTGVFAGILTFAFGTIGYWAKLLAEDIEDIQARNLDAIRAVGGSRFQMITFGVVPQIMPRAVGLTIYRWDSNIRGSVVIGIVGAGGIGLTLLSSYQRYEYDFTLAILIVIVVLVLIGEVVSAYIRGRVQ